MKKLISLGLALCLALSLAACGSGGTSSDPSGSQGSDNASVASGSQSGSNAQSGQQASQDKQVTLPAHFFTDMTQEEIQSAAQEQGFSQCVINQDGSVTYTLTPSKYSEVMEATKTSLNDFISQLVNAEDENKIFTKIEHNDDMSQFDCYVVPDADTPNTAYAYSFCTLGAYYQIFSGVSPDQVNVVVRFVNSSTNQEIQSVTYQDMLNSQAGQ